MKKQIFNILSNIYVIFFGRYYFRFFNTLLFKLSIKGLGYNNYGSHTSSGEINLLKILGKKYEPKVCVDIGANIGNYSKALIKYTNAKIIAFEPNKFAYKELKKIQKIHKKRLVCFEYGISNKKKSMPLYYGSKNSELASVLKDSNKLNFIHGSNKKKMIIKCISLDDFFLKRKAKFSNLDFIKIDTEGHEVEVLEGSKKTINKFKPKVVQIEFNTHQLLKETTLIKYKSFFKNYNTYRILPYGNKLLPIDIYKPENNIFHLSNIVFIHKEINF